VAEFSASIVSNPDAKIQLQFTISFIPAKNATNSIDFVPDAPTIYTASIKQPKYVAPRVTTPFKPYLEFTNTVGLFRIRFTHKLVLPSFTLY